MIRYLLFARILGIVVLSFTASFLMLKGFLFIPGCSDFVFLRFRFSYIRISKRLLSGWNT